ncbi:4-alpha-glucanotransferase family protein [Tritrichomonas foetus]|uniref:4-alpha-glucanotransferase n=1 Tax=Tritrichomonas foetus TaxID=1144522 RepID=A0A1J4K6V6_9EUKA|nr:4-alpha-glucanotransferase family protein [Tritrichomonas foetus]|eukprot:OHT06706.1 4-alpha-glucanotransferase family protein [Tritrichomonas foetus]
MMISISFHLKSQKRGGCSVYLYGSLPELGGGDPTKSIEMTRSNGSYSFYADIKTSLNNDSSNFWYRYYFKTRFGAIINEVCPPRKCYLNIHDNINNSVMNFYDTFDIPSSIGGVVIQFRVQYKANYGQKLFVCGDNEILGKWKPENAVQLEPVLNSDFSESDIWTTTVMIPSSNKPISFMYKYIVFTSPKNFFWEPQHNHCFEIGACPSPSVFVINDVCQWCDNLYEIYSRDPFVKVINRRQTSQQPLTFVPNNTPDTVFVNFTVRAPHVRPSQVLSIIGSTQEVGEWYADRSYQMNDSEFPVWKATISFKTSDFPIEYKYVLLDRASNDVIYEQRYNRVITLCDLESVDRSFPTSININDWYTNPNPELYKGFGITTSLFTLKTEKSCGIGQFTDLPKLVDYCKKIGSSLIHLLPINDTSGSGDWEDSNPFNIISGRALHPIYIDLLAIHGVSHSDLCEIAEKKQKFESLNGIDYPKVYKFKIKKLKEIFIGIESSLGTNNQYRAFVKNNQDWLRMYGLFCYFRDQYKTKNFNKWPQHNSITHREIKQLSTEYVKELQFYYWVQYICHKQLLSAKEYAEEHSIVLEGEVALHSPYQSVSVWANPDLYNIDMITGEVPTNENMSSFNCLTNNGNNYQNSSPMNNSVYSSLNNSPSFNWKGIAATNYAQWCDRITYMSKYFHMIQINQSTSIFRFFEVNNSQSIHSILGHFNPAIPLSKAELKEHGLLDIDRYTKPYVRWYLLKDKFGDDADLIASTFFNHFGTSLENQIFSFKPEYNSEKKISKYFKKKEMNQQQREIWEKGLIELIDNVLLVEDPEKLEHYHARAEACIEKVIQNNKQEKTVISSTSWLDLPKAQKEEFANLLTDYFYHRQNELWTELSYPKLRTIKNSTNALLCSDNVERNHLFIGILQDFNILSSRVQRIPRYYGTFFDKVREYPYLSIATPATSQMPSLRDWWEENQQVTADFWKHEIWRTDEPPRSCEPWVQELILKQHLTSQSMWAVFMLQDIISIDERFRQTNPEKERITPCPSEFVNNERKWNRRMQFTLEKINEADDFCYRIRRIVEDSNRI